MGTLKQTCAKVVHTVMSTTVNDEEKMMLLPGRVNRAWWWKHVEIEGKQFGCNFKDCEFKFSREKSTNPTTRGSNHYLKKHSNKNPALKAAKNLKKLNLDNKIFENLKSDPKSKKSICCCVY